MDPAQDKLSQQDALLLFVSSWAEEVARHHAGGETVVGDDGSGNEAIDNATEQPDALARLWLQTVLNRDGVEVARCLEAIIDHLEIIISQLADLIARN